MKKTLLTLFATIFTSVALIAQAPPQRNCGTLQHHQYLMQTRPNYANDLNQYNQVIDQYLQDRAADIAAGRVNNSALTPTIIPVVVHVVYRTAVPATSITIAQAASQVQVLNDDFAKLNADAIKVTQPTFSTVASGANIRFCLAQRDPNGNPTTGVDYKLTTTATFGTNDAVKSAATGGADAWDVTKYVNIWVCDLGATLLGYGEFPTTALSNTWGLVLHYKYTGSGGSAIAPYNLGRTGTHEFGHCFNLLHIWGDDGTACTGSDQCSDTPNQAGEHYGCFAQGSIQTDGCTSASPGVMWMNYMDYTDDACMYMFTAQQAARMEAVVSTAPWNVLQTSLGCTPVSALDAGITSVINPTNGSSTCNTSITPKITLNNAGSTTLTSAIVNYKMDALATQTLSWTGSLASATSTVLTLNVYTGLAAAAHTFSVWVTAPNGGTDQNAANNSASASFTVVAAPVGQALPFTERFDAVTFPPTGWVKTSANVTDATATWSRLANTTGIPVVPTTTACAKMNNFAGNIDITGQLDALRSPALSFSGTNSTLRVVFDRSHRIYSATDIDSLNIYISTDCGGTWTRLFTKGGSQLATVTGTLSTAYTPTANAQWVRDSVSLSAYVGQPSVYIKFESRSGWGNNLYLDNINVKYTPATAPPVASFSTAATKCVGNAITFSDQSTNGPSSWAWTFPGGTPATSTSQNPSVTYTASGTYTATLISANSSGTSTAVSQTITVNASPSVAVSNASVCAGSAASLTASGATTYLWNTGATTTSISVTPSVTTNYTVTGTTSGCTNTKTISVTVNANPTVAVSNATVCNGTAANLTASGATSYSWNTGATTTSISVTPTVTTNYTVIGTTSGCTNTKTVSVTVRATPTVAVTNATICAGSSRTLTATGATTYSWNTGATNASISVTPSITTTYSVVGTNTLGCSNTKTVSVSVNALPAVVVSSSTICAGSTGTIVASGATTYLWNTGATSANLAVSPTVTTNYTVTGTTAGCTKTATASVSVGSAPSIAVNSTSICAGSTATLSASGVTTYTWNTGANTSSISVTPASTTVYTVTGNLTGCVAMATKTVNVLVTPNPTVAVSNATICSGNAANLIATGATSYVWNTSATTSSISVTPASNTNYTVTGTTLGCTNTKTLSVTVKATPTVAVSNATICSGNATNLIATGATSYVWNTGATTSSVSVSPSTSVTYTVVGTTNGCSNTQLSNVTVNTTPTVAVSNTTICSGNSANLTATGATSYVWNTGATTAAIAVSPSSNTDYSVTGTTSGCSNTQTMSVLVNATPTVVVNNATICSGSSANLTASGASNYSWDTGATTASVSVSPTSSTNYSVTGTTSGCSNTQVVSVTVNSLPVITASSSTICAGSVATIAASGASTYTWNTGANTSSINDSPVSTTSYTVVGTSAQGCNNYATATVNVVSAPSISVNSATICAGSTATLAASGVTTYTWSTTSNSSTIFVNPTSTTVYTVNGNLTGCATLASQQVTVAVNALPIVSLASIASPICVNDAAVTLSGSPVGGVYSGTGVSGSSFNPSVSGAGTFTTSYNYTDGNGCSASANQVVNVSLCTGIFELNDNTVSVYPNPTNDMINITMDAELVNYATIELYDAIGKLVVSEKAKQTTTKVSLSNYANGMYTIRIVAEGKQSIIKVVKN